MLKRILAGSSVAHGVPRAGAVCIRDARGGKCLNSQATPASNSGTGTAGRQSTRSLSTSWSTANNALLSWGVGCNGALGTGNTNSVDEPTPVKFFKDKNVVEAAAGWAHSAVVTSDGQAYCFGRTHDLRNALRVTRMFETWPRFFFKMFNFVGGNASIDYLQPTHMPIPGIASKVRCSAGLTAVISKTGEVYMLGANRFGQCGVGTRTTFEWQPTLLKGMEKEVVRDVQLGFQHVVCVTESGHAYTWGKGLTGQLGWDEELLELTWPRRVPYFQREDLRVISVGAGFNHTVFLTDDGRVWTCGKYQSLKLDEFDEKRNFAHQFTPRPVDFAAVLPKDVKIVKVQCGLQHSVAIADDGSVWQWGMQPDDDFYDDEDEPEVFDTDGHGQGLSGNRGGRYSKHRMLQVPVQVQGIKVEPGAELFTGHGETCVLRDGGVVVWDWSLHPKAVHSLDPERVGTVLSVHLGWKHTLAITQTSDPNCPNESYNVCPQ